MNKAFISSFLLSSLLFFLCKAIQCPSYDQGITVEQSNNYKKRLDNLMKEREEIAKLHKKCLNERFIVLTELRFSDGTFSFRREEFVNYEIFFQTRFNKELFDSMFQQKPAIGA